MLLLRPNRLPSGAMVFPDSADENRYYLHPAEVHVVRLDFQRDPNGHHRFLCELEFGASDEDLRLLPGELQDKDVVPVPWIAGPVMMWGICAGRPRLLSRGTNSGLGAQKSVHQNVLPFVPYEIMLTTELVCSAEVDGAIIQAQWIEDEENLFPVLIDDLDRAVEEAFETRRLVTTGRLALEVLEHQQEERRLMLQTKGPDGEALRRQTLLTLAHQLLNITYGEEVKPIDLIDQPIRAQRLEPKVPDLQSAVGRTLCYRMPLTKQIGHIPGECTYKVAVGFDWSRITSVNVHVDGATPEVLEEAGTTPWYTAVLSQTRQTVTKDRPCSGHVWTEAAHRDYPFPLSLPSPETVEDTVIIDAPSLEEDSLSVTVSDSWPESLMPLEIRLTGPAGHIAPSDGVLRFEGARGKTTITYQGLRWSDPDTPLEKTVHASLSYNLGGSLRGCCHLDLHWGQNNRLDPETIPKLTVAVPSKNREIDATVEVTQGQFGPLVSLGRFDIPENGSTAIYLDGELTSTWLRTTFVSSKHDYTLTEAWRKVEERTVTLEWPELKKLQFSVAPDVAPGTALWVAASIDSVSRARLIELGPFLTKIYLLAPAGGVPGYLIALMQEDQRSPPTAESGRWLPVERTKLRLNSTWLARLKSRGSME